LIFRFKEEESEEDEDLKLFENVQDNEDEKSNKDIQQIINLSSQKDEKHRILQERKNKRIIKLQEFFFSKAYLIIQIGR